MSAEPVAMNPLQAIRTIRACESEAAAQLRLEHYASVVRAMAIVECAKQLKDGRLEKGFSTSSDWEDGYNDGISDSVERIRALSSPPSVSEEWIKKVVNSITVYGTFERRAEFAAVRATLAALGVKVEGAAK